MLKQFLAFGVLTAVSGCTINITTEGPHEGFDHEWHEEKEEWHHEHDDHHGYDHHDDRDRGGHRARGATLLFLRATRGRSLRAAPQL